MADKQTNTTPPRTTPSFIAPDTVPRSRHTGTPSYRTGDLLCGRVAVLKDLGPIPVVPLKYFNSAALPPLRNDIDVQKIERALQASGKITSGQWREYQSNPSNGTANEEDYYKHLCSIFTAVTKQAKKGTGTGTTVDFIQKPNSAPMSERANSSRPDGYMLLKKKKSVKSGTDSRDFWDDVAVSFEFKKYGKDKDKQDNERKLIWSLHHIMRSDPCRRSTLGVTIEGANMRLWFTCRSVTMVSKPFDFIKDTSQLIHFFCSVAFADDHELGWDPSIRRILVDGHAQYEITLNSANGSSVYVTTDTLADFGAEAMRGRGTRVFKGYCKGDPDKTPVAIKDTWRASDREREDVILNEIFADMAKVMDKAEVEDVQKHFLTVRDAGDVVIKGKVDDTLCLLRGENPPSDCKMYEIPPEEPPSADKLSKETTTTHTTMPPVSDFKVSHRVHTRIVFKEVCETLYSVRDLRGVMQMLLDVLKVLQLLHKSGWVHRDISPGNLMRIGGSVKLADLEYAKRLGSDQTHDFRTGTHHFMACEVESHRYHFHLKQVDRPKRVAKNLLPEPSFTFNPVHDLESLWWVWVWVMYFYVDEDKLMRPAQQDQAFRSLFPDYIPAKRLESLMDSLKADVPLAFQDVINYTDVTRGWLVKSYIGMETLLPPNYTHFLPELMDSFLEALELAVDFAGDTKLYIPPEHRKRKEPEREEGNLLSAVSNKRNKQG